MAIEGLDVQEVQNLSRQMNDAAQQIEGLSSRLTSMLSGTQWIGNDANAFRNDWTGHQAALRQVVSSLQAASQAAARNAEQQVAASA